VVEDFRDFVAKERSANEDKDRKDDALVLEEPRSKNFHGGRRRWMEELSGWGDELCPGTRATRVGSTVTEF